MFVDPRITLQRLHQEVEVIGVWNVGYFAESVGDVLDVNLPVVGLAAELLLCFEDHVSSIDHVGVVMPEID